MTRNEDMGSAESYLCDNSSENGKVEEKCYFDVILVAVYLILKLGVSWGWLNEPVKVLGEGE